CGYVAPAVMSAAATTLRTATPPNISARRDIRLSKVTTRPKAGAGAISTRPSSICPTALRRSSARSHATTNAERPTRGIQCTCCARRSPSARDGERAGKRDCHQREEPYMSKVTYEIVEHDGGWAYRVDGVFSETFPSHDMARRAAERAAKEQVLPGETTGISYEDKDGRWHDEVSKGDDRPETDVEG